MGQNNGSLFQPPPPSSAPTGDQPPNPPEAGRKPVGNDPMPAGIPDGDQPEELVEPDGTLNPQPPDEPSEEQQSNLHTEPPEPTDSLPDNAYDIPIDQITAMLTTAKVPREERTIRGYCERGLHIDCKLRRADGTHQMKYHSYQSSIDNLISHLKEVDTQRQILTTPNKLVTIRQSRECQPATSRLTHRKPVGSRSEMTLCQLEFRMVTSRKS